MREGGVRGEGGGIERPLHVCVRQSDLKPSTTHPPFPVLRESRLKPHAPVPWIGLRSDIHSYACKITGGRASLFTSLQGWGGGVYMHLKESRLNLFHKLGTKLKFRCRIYVRFLDAFPLFHIAQLFPSPPPPTPTPRVFECEDGFSRTPTPLPYPLPHTHK